MNVSTSDLWQSVLGELEVSLSRANYKTWFRNTSLIGVEDGIGVVGVPNIFTREWISKKYNAQIFDALSKLVPGLEKIEYKINASSSKAPSKDPRAASAQPALNSDSEVKKNPAKQKSNSPSNTTTKQKMLAKYRFSNFIVGDSNRLAFAAAKLVAEKPGEHYNPLFLYGPVGVGKTHLMWAINDATISLSPSSTTSYVTSEEFVNEFTRAIREGQTKQFTDKYRRVDLLLVDDLQFLAGKEKTLEEFFHTFNALHQANKQIVLCSDRPPKAIPTLDDRLRSRFEWGMVADIAPPDLETRVAILQSKARLHDFQLTDDIALLIAELVETNIRELEGALTRVIAYCQLQDIPISTDIVLSVLGGNKRDSLKRLNPRTVVEKVASFYGVRASELSGNKRDREIVLPRQVAMYLMREELHLSFPQIAHVLGGRDHTTVMHGVKKINKELINNDTLSHEIKTLRNNLFSVG